MISSSEIAKLRSFHALHFPGQPMPGSHPADPLPQTAADETDPTLGRDPQEDDHLGYYDDGVRRTLTDEQIEMFRHSEIQRLLSERRAAREREERDKRKQERQRTKGNSAQEKKRRFEDEPETQHQNTETLMYDDPPDEEASSRPAAKGFLWPELKQS